jgi:DNA-binding NtrC family response regulator
MTAPASILVVDDDAPAARLLAEVLTREGYQVTTALSVAEAVAALDGGARFDAALTDLRMPGASGFDLVRELKARDPEAIVLVLTAFGSAQAAGEAIAGGAYDFVSKPVDLNALRLALGRALERRRLEIENRALKVRASFADADPIGGRVVGNSPQMIDIMKQAARVAPTQATVLLTGETGTGKERVARMIHGYSTRAGKTFVAINCGALAEGLLESELFGHVKGAFTGAVTARSGMFREADGGTLFLDEIGDISPALQVRLLRAIQEREIVPVGAETAVPVDVRLIASTRRDLSAMVRAGSFREDLYYRLHVVTLTLPPLRERRQDLPALVEHFLLGQAARLGRGPIGIEPAAQAALLAYDWPGNVRELENVIERAVVLARHDVLSVDDLPEEIRRGPTSPSVPSGGAQASASPPANAATMLPLDEVDRLHVLRVLEAVNGNREEAARILGISRRTLTRMAQRWTLPESRTRG